MHLKACVFTAVFVQQGDLYSVEIIFYNDGKFCAAFSDGCATGWPREKKGRQDGFSGKEGAEDA